MVGVWVVSVESSELVSVVVSGQESVNVSVKNSESKSVFKLFPHCSLKYLSILHENHFVHTTFLRICSK